MHGRGIERTAHVDPDRQGRGAQDGAGCRIAGQHLRAGGRREPGVGDAELQVEVAGAPRQAAAGQERIEIEVAVAADGQVVSPLAQEVVERGRAAIGLAIDLIQQAMAVRVVQVVEIVGVVVEQAEDPVERRIRLLSRELPGDPGGAVEREAEPFHVRGALGTAADRALLLVLRAGADMPQVDGLVQGLVRQGVRRGGGTRPEGAAMRLLDSSRSKRSRAAVRRYGHGLDAGRAVRRRPGLSWPAITGDGPTSGCLEVGFMARELLEFGPAGHRAAPLQTWMIMGSAATLKMPSKFTASNVSR